MNPYANLSDEELYAIVAGGNPAPAAVGSSAFSTNPGTFSSFGDLNQSQDYRDAMAALSARAGRPRQTASPQVDPFSAALLQAMTAQPQPQTQVPGPGTQMPVSGTGRVYANDWAGLGQALAQREQMNRSWNLAQMQDALARQSLAEQVRQANIETILKQQQQKLAEQAHKDEVTLQAAQINNQLAAQQQEANLARDRINAQLSAARMESQARSQDRAVGREYALHKQEQEIENDRAKWKQASEDRQSATQMQGIKAFMEDAQKERDMKLKLAEHAQAQQQRWDQTVLPYIQKNQQRVADTVTAAQDVAELRDLEKRYNQASQKVQDFSSLVNRDKEGVVTGLNEAGVKARALKALRDASKNTGKKVDLSGLNPDNFTYNDSTGQWEVGGMLKRMWNAATSGSVWDTHNKETADAYLNALNQVTGMATQSNMSTAMNTQAQLLQDMESLYRSARDRKISLTTSGASVPGINGKVSPESVSKTVQLYEYDKTGKPTGKVYNVPSQLVDQTLEVLNLQRGETQWGIYK